MRIAIISSEYGSGGVGTYTFHVSSELSKNNEVFVFCAPEQSNYSPVDGVEVIEVPLKNISFSGPDIQKLAWSVDVRRHIRELNNNIKCGIDVINPHLSPAFFYPLFMNEIPGVLTLHTTHLMEQHHPAKWYRKLVGQVIDRIACERSQRAIVLNHTFKFNLENKLKSTEVVQVPNGVDVAAHADSPSEDDINEFEAEYGVDTDKSQALFLSRLERVKRPMAMVEAANAIPDDSSILIAGGGSLEQEIRNAASNHDNITVMERVPEDHKHIAYHTSDLFVLPSVREGMPTVVLEAMAAGLPILATNIPGSRDLVTDSVGWLTHPDLSNFEHDMAKALSDEETLTTKGTNAQQRAKQFDWSKVAEMIEAELRDVANE